MGQIPRFRLRSAALTGLFLCLLAALSAAQTSKPREQPSLLLGGARPLPAPAPVDPRLPTGPERRWPARPSGHTAICSEHRPVCIHATRTVERNRTASALAALESAYERLVFALSLPTPFSDQGRGGSDALDWYLSTDNQPRLDVMLEARGAGKFDRASAFCRANIDGVDAAELERQAVLCVGEAIAARLDPALPPELRRAYAVHLWWMVGWPTARDLAAIRQFQSQPFRGPLGTERPSEGAALWFEYLDTALGQNAPGRLTTSLISLSGNRTPADSTRYHNEPDIFDVLRHSLENDPSRLAHVVNDYAVARAFLGSRDDGTHFPRLGWAAHAGRVKFDWVLEYSTLPRRVAITHPLEPLGSVYLWLDLDEVALGDVLGMQVQWEPPVGFTWSLVKVSKDGRELSRLEVPYQQRATVVEQRLVGLENAAGILIVGTNLGGVDLAHPFDPDRAPFEPHSALVYLVKL